MSAAGPVRLAVTVGDPAGIGPEIVARALRDADRIGLRFAVFGDAVVLEQLELSELRGVTLVDSGGPFDPARDPIGRPTIASGESAARALLLAIDACLAGDVDGVVTAPLSKEALHLAGHPWPGQTEVLIERAGVPRGVMLFVGGGLRVALATRHLRLADVPGALSVDAIAADLALLAAALRRDFGVPRPRIGVAGLNPHAGEGGLFGDEEQLVIAPAIAATTAIDPHFEPVGPLPADTVFVRHDRGELDAVLAMYHDQGLIPVKLKAFGGGVNTTVGLPFVRTSPDHGTAFDIAGKGVADPTSMLAAVRVAADAARHRRGVGA